MTTIKVEPILVSSPITSPLSSPPPLSPRSLDPSAPVKQEPSSTATPGESQPPSQAWPASKETTAAQATSMSSPRRTASPGVLGKAPVAASKLAPPFQPFFPQQAAEAKKIKQEEASADSNASTTPASKTAQALSRVLGATSATDSTSPKAAASPSPAGCPCSGPAAQQWPPAAPLAPSQYGTQHSYGYGWSAAPLPPQMQHSLRPPPGLPAANQHYAGPSMSSSHPRYHHQAHPAYPSWPFHHHAYSAWQHAQALAHYAASTAPIRAELEAARWKQGVTWADLDRFFRDRRERNYCADIFAGIVRPMPVDLEILGLRLGIDRQRLYEAFQPYGMPSALRHR